MPPLLLRTEGTQEMQSALTTGVVNTSGEGTLAFAMDTRRGQGKHVTGKEKRDIAADVREFRSSQSSHFAD